MRIAREGVSLILSLVGLHLLFLAGGALAGNGNNWPHLHSVFLFVSFIFALLALFSLYFFRDPKRRIPEGDNLVLSPADGRVLALEEVVEDRFLGGPARRVSIFMNIFDVHVNRFPISGTVRFKEYRKGKFFNASLDKASIHNEALSIGAECENSTCRVLVRQVAGLVARRIVCRVKEGDILRRGDRFGMIKFGSRLEVYLPPEVRWRVAQGDRVLAGETVLAEIP